MADEVTYDQLLDVLYSEEARWNDTGHAYVAELTDPTAWLPPFLALMWLTGGRVSEVLAIRGKDFREENVEGHVAYFITLPNLKQRKNAEKETLVIPAQYPVAWAYVENYRLHLENPDSLLFHRSRKTVWAHCNRIFGFGCHKAGRHSWVMNQARRGAQLLDIKQLGGWASLSSMQPYISKFGRKELVKRMVEQKD